MYTITSDPLSLDTLLKDVSHPGAGAVVLFLGVVRDNNEDRSVNYLEYEAHEVAARASMEQIGQEAEKRWPGARISAAHRIGRLEIGEASVLVGASAPHRAEAFEAARYVIDTLKAESPIWKKEVFEGGEVWIGEGS
ncbi:MAG: molybdenum cofactor biosynthesis protein MoaE [Chloroflexota bacterium]|nr:molybdenum cofactor biosynthesis protein MoaE [Chloroflexota bacterium]